MFNNPSILNRLEMVKTEVRTAFRDTPYPGDDNVLYEPGCNHDECLMIKRIFTGKRWEDITLAELLPCRYFSFFYLVLPRPIVIIYPLF